jgi:glycosyl transferase, family 25
MLRQFSFIQIINLRERRDRRQQMASELRRIGLSFDDDRVELVEGSRFADRGGFDSAGARGCFDSHLRALKRAHELGAPSMLLLEDDCDFSSDIRKALPAALAALESTLWSMFYGGYNSWSGTGRAYSPIAPVSPTDSLLGTHFVAFSADAIRQLIPYLSSMRERPPGSPQGGPMHVDGAYDWFRAAHGHLPTWVANPILGRQRPSRTDVHELRPIERVPLARSAISFARNVRRALGKLR